MWFLRLFWLHSAQHFVAGVAANLFDGVEMGLQGWLVFQEAVGDEVETTARTQHVRRFADEAVGDCRGLETAEMEGRVGHHEIEALCQDSLRAIAGEDAHVTQTALLAETPREGNGDKACIYHRHAALRCQSRDAQPQVARS